MGDALVDCFVGDDPTEPAPEWLRGGSQAAPRSLRDLLVPGAEWVDFLDGEWSALI